MKTKMMGGASALVSILLLVVVCGAIAGVVYFIKNPVHMSGSSHTGKNLS